MDNECADFFTNATNNSDYVKFIDAVKQGLLTEKDIDVSLKRLFTARFRLGMFDPPEMVTSMRRLRNRRSTATLIVNSHSRAARESIVLLKNNGVSAAERGHSGRLPSSGHWPNRRPFCTEITAVRLPTQRRRWREFGNNLLQPR